MDVQRLISSGGAWYNIFNEHGYSSKQRKDGSYLVKFSANGYTGRQKTQDFALLRTAELCLEQGMSYIELLDADSNYMTMPVSGVFVSYPRSQYLVRFYNVPPQTDRPVLEAEPLYHAIRAKHELDKTE